MRPQIPCTRDCPDRTPWCHGQEPDGTWRCERWRDYRTVYEKNRAIAMAKIENGAYDREKKRRIRRIKERGK